MSNNEQSRDNKAPTIVPTVVRVGVVVAVNATFIFLAWFVVPKWKKVFEDFQAELSSLSILAIEVSDVIVTAGPLVLLSLVALTPLYAWFDRRLVVTGQKGALRFTFGVLAGIPLLTACAFAGAITMSCVGLIRGLSD
jgi:type II secretory pathway component PulF